MKLTEWESRFLIKKIEKLWKRPKCEVCDTNCWSMIDTVMTMTGYQSRGEVPLVVFLCTCCGNMRIHNAIAIGLIGTCGELLEKKT